MDETTPSFKRIKGETPIDDVSELKVKGIATRAELSRLEADNISRAMARYLGGAITHAQAPFTYPWFLQLHREMFEDVWGWAGRLRTSRTSIGVAPHLIGHQLYELTLNLSCWAEESLLFQAAMLHHQAVRIHPFENGNGRWSRMLANIWLHVHDHPITHWPAEALSEESAHRDAYLAAIKAADRGNYDPLLVMQEQYTPDEE